MEKVYFEYGRRKGCGLDFYFMRLEIPDFYVNLSQNDKVKMESFGQYIRNLRTGKGYTLTEIGAKLKVDSAGLSKIERKQKNETETENITTAYGNL